MRGAIRGRGQRELHKTLSLQDLREQFNRIDKACSREEAEAFRLREELKRFEIGSKS